MKKIKSITNWSIGLVACVAMISLASCSGGSSSNSSTADSTGLTDPEIASIAVTANQIDVDYAKVALSKSQDSTVIHFADAMQKDHSNIINQAVALAKKLGVTPKDNPTTQSLLAGEKTTMAKFDSLSGAAFNKAYINNEVAYHKAVISAIKNKLIPATKNADLKAFLQKAMPLLNQHLEMAKSAQKAVASESTAPDLTDPEVASVAVTANQIDVNYAEIALKKSKNATVKHFAETMKKDHTNIIKQAAALAKKLGVTPKDNAVTQSLLKGEKATTAKLDGLTGDAFNKAYIDNEVAYHKAVINAVKTVLIPTTDNAQLKALLQKVMPLLNQHLQMAENAQTKIEK